MERRLGRGLGSLLGQAGEADAMPQAESQNETVGRMIETAAIRRNPDQPRRTFDSGGLEELRQSIERHGVLQPICVRRVGEGYEIISGERRWRAARNAGLVRIPAIVKDDVDDAVSLELAIVENVQRLDLDPIEKAHGYRSLMERVGLTQEEVAARVGVQRSSVANQLRLLELPEEAQDALSRGMISFGHARALLAFRGADKIRKALEEVVRKDLSVRETEQLARPEATAKSATTTPAPPPWVGEIEKRLREALGVKVTLRNGARYKGSITLEYSGREELERVCDRIAPKSSI